jgi:hypothetical protein
MPGAERTRRSNERYDPIAHVVLEPLTGPAPSRSNTKSTGAQPPRPQNAWILYRAWALGGLLEKQPELKGKPQAQISKILGSQWATETPEIRKHFEHQANLQKERHAQEFPDYVFKPQKKEDKERERETKKKERAKTREAEKLRKEVAKALRSGHPPQSLTGIPEGGTGVMTFATPDSDLHKFAVYSFDDLGPSPPMSACPSPAARKVEIEDQEMQDSEECDAPTTSEENATKTQQAAANTSTAPSQSGLDSTSMQSSPDSAVPWDFKHTQATDAQSSNPFGVISGDFNDYLTQAFPSFDPDAPTDVSLHMLLI